MSVEETVLKKELPAALVTEAAAWVARLHGPLRTPAVEQGFRNWLKAHPDHAAALELVTESWDEVAALRSAARIEVSLPGDKPKFKSVRLPWALAAGLLIVAIGGLIVHLRPTGVITKVGEQRMLALQDGSHIYLNTSTRVRVDYGRKTRRVHFISGEALFEVAKDPKRPFSVIAGNREVTALGTSFLVRRHRQLVAVTLVEGKVAVAPIVEADGSARAQSDAATVLTPGERLTFGGERRPHKLDRPDVETLTAWQRGKVPIENLSLADAVAEMNRYSAVPLVLDRVDAQRLRVSGIFRAGDSLSFARAVAASYGLDVREQSDRIVLLGAAH
jgi:transmembrane sensor